MADPRYPTPLAAELADDVLERFLRYVRIDTQSDDDSESYPSTAKQRDLGAVLERELRELGLEDVELTRTPPVALLRVVDGARLGVRTGAGADACVGLA